MTVFTSKDGSLWGDEKVALKAPLSGKTVASVGTIGGWLQLWFVDGSCLYVSAEGGAGLSLDYTTENTTCCGDPADCNEKECT